MPAEALTSEAEKRGYGQRRINLIWEITQALIAVGVCAATLVVAAALSVRENGISGPSFILLSNAFFLVIGFYFGRTNHTRADRSDPSND